MSDPRPALGSIDAIDQFALYDEPGGTMGNRANFDIVENGDWRLHYSHWAGCRMLDALIGGPELALLVRGERD